MPRGRPKLLVAGCQQRGRGRTARVGAVQEVVSSLWSQLSAWTILQANSFVSRHDQLDFVVVLVVGDVVEEQTEFWAAGSFELLL